MQDVVSDNLAVAEQAYGVVINFLVTYGFQVLGAILILLIGFWVAGKVGNSVAGLCERKNVDVTLGKFAGSVTRIVVLTCFIVISLGKFGISVAPFLAAIGAVGLGAGCRGADHRVART